MKKMQDVLMSHIEKVIGEAGLEPVVQYVYSNTGTLYLMDGLKTKGKIKFDFQTCDVTLQCVTGTKDITTYGPDACDFFINKKYHAAAVIIEDLEFFLDDLIGRNRFEEVPF